MSSTKEPKRPLLKRKSTRIALLGLAVVIAGLWFARPEPPPPARSSGELMKAIVYREYGPPDVLRLEQAEKLLPGDDQVLIRVRAAAANPLDWHYVRGTPYLLRLDNGFRRPKSPRLGVDVAGEVVAVGRNVTEFKPGDEVFGVAGGAFAEFARASRKRIAPKPAHLTFEQAAGVPVAAITALQGLRDAGKLEPGQKVLINGASGGVGTFAVQIAKALGAEVTGVCSTRNVELVRSLGADHVIDYTKESFTEGPRKYDLILDNVGNHSLSTFRRVLNPEGTYVLIGGGGPNDGRWIGPFGRVIAMFLLDPFVSQELGMMIAEVTKDDLLLLKGLMEAGKVTPVVDRTYSLSEVPEAIRYLETGRARGKVIITLGESDET